MALLSIPINTVRSVLHRDQPHGEVSHIEFLLRQRGVGEVMDERSERTKRLARFGEFLLAILTVYSGVMHFKFARFVAGIVPAWIPWHLFWAYFTGVALFAAGVSIVVRKQTRLAATLLGIMLSFFVVLIHTPSMVHSIVNKPEDISVLWSFNGTGGVNNALKDVALALSALILAASKETKEQNSRRTKDLLLGNSFAMVMVLFGLEHFFYTDYTPGIPSWSFVSFWIPWRLFWGYLTGAILLVGGTMFLTRRKPREAATALGFMILVVAVLTYAFRMAAHMSSFSELTNTIKDVAVAGGALVLSGITSSESPILQGTHTPEEPAQSPFHNRDFSVRSHGKRTCRLGTLNEP